MRSVVIMSGGEAKRYDVEDIDVAASGVVMKLRGVDSKEQAAALIGAEMQVRRRHAARRRRGEYYVADLVGSTVIRDGTPVGRVLGVVTTGASDLLEIGLTSDEVILVPFVKEYIGRVQTRRRRIELKSNWELE